MGTDIYPIETASIRAFQRCNSFIYSLSPPPGVPGGGGGGLYIAITHWIFNSVRPFGLYRPRQQMGSFQFPYGISLNSSTPPTFFLYFLLAGTFETFYLVSHSNLYMLTSRTASRHAGSLPAVTWRDSTRLSMSSERRRCHSKVSLCHLG